MGYPREAWVRPPTAKLLRGRDTRTDFTRSVKPMMAALLVLSAGGNVRASIWSLVVHAGPFAKGILLLLFGLSIWCWAVIGNRLLLYARVEGADRRFLAAVRRLKVGADSRLVCEQHPDSLLAKVALAGQRTLDQHRPDAALTLAS